MKFFIKDFLGKFPCPNPEEYVDLVTFTEELLNGKLHFLCSVWSTKVIKCIYETFLHSCTSSDGFNLKTPDRSFRNDHLLDNKRMCLDTLQNLPTNSEN